MSDGTLKSLALATALLRSVPGSRATVYAEDEGAFEVSTAAGGVCSPDELRLAVSEAIAIGRPEPVQTLLGMGEQRPKGIVVRGNRNVWLEGFDAGYRWRKSCEHGVTEFLVAPHVSPMTNAVAESVLSDVMVDSGACLWSSEDQELGVTVLACEWPSELTDGEAGALEQALRDLGIMWRVRGNFEDAEA